ncbi:hypothetical protein F4819DRAFT_160386 [Hypoxylon fuscum]|nr:hypothetical protein F4819DRAFT_160386 [Hypoxylon fuscum]
MTIKKFSVQAMHLSLSHAVLANIVHTYMHQLKHMMENTSFVMAVCIQPINRIGICLVLDQSPNVIGQSSIQD